MTSAKFIRIVDEDGFESLIDLKNECDLFYFLNNLKIGTKIQIRSENWFSLNAEIVPFDSKLPD